VSYQGHGLQSASSAYRIPDGQVVLLTHLQEGQRATVLQLPAQVKRAGAEHPALPEAGHVLDRQRDPPGRLNLHEGKIPVPVAGTAPRGWGGEAERLQKRNPSVRVLGVVGDGLRQGDQKCPGHRNADRPRNARRCCDNGPSENARSAACLNYSRDVWRPSVHRRLSVRGDWRRRAAPDRRPCRHERHVGEPSPPE